jgi:hypothetical protein
MKYFIAFVAVFAITFGSQSIHFLSEAVAQEETTTADIPETKELKEVVVHSGLDPVEVVQDEKVSSEDFLQQVLSVIKSFGGLPMVLQISSIIMLIISSMKNSLLRELLWDKLGDGLKPWIAPLLGLIAGLLGVASEGPVTFASVFAYMSAGAGAIILHELLGTLKAMPGIGPVYLSIIDIIQRALKSPKAKNKS